MGDIPDKTVLGGLEGEVQGVWDGGECGEGALEGAGVGRGRGLPSEVC